MRAAIVILWLAVQLALVFTGSSRPQGAFAFRMFPETSDVEVHLWRRVRGGARVPADFGWWRARGADGVERGFSYAELTGPFAPHLRVRTPASYGARAQLAALDAALDWCVHHIPDDAETISLGADVTVWRNGRAPEYLTVEKAR